MLSRPGVAVLATLLPGLAVAAAAAALLVGEVVDLAGLYGVSGVVTVTAFGGALPVLLAVAAGRRGDLPGPARPGLLDAAPLRALGLVAVVVVLVAHATVAWDQWWARAAAVAALAGLVGVAARSWGRGRFAPGASVVVLDDRQAGSLHLWAQRAGRPWPVRLDAGPTGSLAGTGWLALDGAAVPAVALDLPGGPLGPPGGTVAVTCLRRLPDGTVDALGVTVSAGDHRYDVALLGGRAAVPVTGPAHLALLPPG